MREGGLRLEMFFCQYYYDLFMESHRISKALAVALWSMFYVHELHAK